MSYRGGQVVRFDAFGKVVRRATRSCGRNIDEGGGNEEGTRKDKGRGKEGTINGRIINLTKVFRIVSQCFRFVST